MTALNPLDRELLDFLCACAHHRVRVTGIKAPRAASLTRLRELGHVGRDDHLPSGSALLGWIERQRTQSEAAAGPHASEEPPGATAADDAGGGDARKVAPPPKAKRKRGPRTMAERAERFERQRDERNTQGASGTAREAPSASSSDDAKRTKGRAPVKPPASLNEPAAERAGGRSPPRSSPQTEGAGLASRVPEEPVSLVAPMARARPPVDIKVNARRDPAQPPELPLTELRDRQVMQGYRHVAAVHRGQEQHAVSLVDAGIDPATQNSIVSAKMRAVIRRREDEARLSDPIEQAKTVIRQGGWACFAAVIAGGPAGHFYIGNRLVTEQALLEFAERLRTTRRRRA